MSTKTDISPILFASVPKRRRVRIARMRIAAALLVYWCVTTALQAIAAGQLAVESNTAITPPPGAHLNWYEMKADPGDTENLILCGARRSTQENAYVGVVYYSHDGGRSWRMAMEDRNSTWVSEQSCTFGSGHRAYFISEASKVVNGLPDHNLGTTRIFTSADAGEEWVETAQTTWADYSSSAVTSSPAGGDELFVFFNSGADYEPSIGHGNTLGYFVVTDDGKKVSPHRSVPEMAEMNYRGVYPSASVTLNDGSIVVIYNAGMGHAERGRVPIEIGAVRFSAGRPSRPVVIARPEFTYEPPVCPSSLSTSLAYDRGRELLYVAFNSVRAGRCSVMLSRSDDGGRTWSPSYELTGGIASHSSRYFPILVVNGQGVLGLQWRGRADLSPGCWYFSTSRDSLKIDSSTLLSPCTEEDSIRQQSSQYLATLINQSEAGRPVTVQILTLRDYLVRVGIAATPDGVFHPAWIESKKGNSELRTVRVCVLQCGAQSAQSRVPKLTEVTDKVTVYAGEQTVDQRTGTATIKVAFQNRGPITLRAPLYLKIENVDSDFGEISIVNGPGTRIRHTDYFEIAGFGTRFEPQERTPSYGISFRLNRSRHHRSKRYVIAKMTIRVFCKQDSLSHSNSAVERSGSKPSSPSF